MAKRDLSTSSLGSSGDKRSRYLLANMSAGVFKKKKPILLHRGKGKGVKP